MLLITNNYTSIQQQTAISLRGENKMCFYRKNVYFRCPNLVMEVKQEHIIRVRNLVKKYNDILLNSMSIALAEDLINLIVVNEEDKGFELSELVKDKNTFRACVTAEFLKLNSNSVLDDLKTMNDDLDFKMIRNKNRESSQKRLKL